jgi:hypothetical protein
LEKYEKDYSGYIDSESEENKIGDEGCSYLVKAIWPDLEALVLGINITMQ